jgi:hypothetical protein
MILLVLHKGWLLQYERLALVVYNWRHDIQHNDTEHNDIQHNIKNVTSV